MLDKRFLYDALELLSGFGEQDISVPGTLGNMFESIQDNPILQDISGRNYVDYRLSLLAKAIGLNLVGVRITKQYWGSDIEDVSTQYDVKYLRADAICFDNGARSLLDLGYRFHVFLARYSGLEDEWKRLQDTTATDLIVRFSIKESDPNQFPRYYSQTWLSAFYGDEEVVLHGERIDYDNLRYLANQEVMCKQWDSSFQHVWSSKELDDLRRDAFDGF